jgi:hypothetical protein
MEVNAAVEMLHALLDVYAEEELYSDYGMSPQLSATVLGEAQSPPVTTHMDVDRDKVVGVVPGTHRRKGELQALHQGSTKLAEVYKLLREQTECAGEIMLPSLASDTAAEGRGERNQVRRRDTLEVWGGGSDLSVGSWNYEQMCVPLGFFYDSLD